MATLASEKRTALPYVPRDPHITENPDGHWIQKIHFNTNSRVGEIHTFLKHVFLAIEPLVHATMQHHDRASSTFFRFAGGVLTACLPCRCPPGCRLCDGQQPRRPRGRGPRS